MAIKIPLTMHFVKEKDCKHSVRYKAVNEDSPIATIYVFRDKLGNPVPKKLELTLKETK